MILVMGSGGDRVYPHLRREFCSNGALFGISDEGRAPRCVVRFLGEEWPLRK